ncbi:MAG: magnesium transporter [SAR324 cluster bacterium]|nr:magnesium transporter [SAR324 cluster bacterium]
MMEQRKELWDILEDIIQAEDVTLLKKVVNESSLVEVALALSRLSIGYQVWTLVRLTPKEGAKLVREMPHVQAVELIRTMPLENTVALLKYLRSDVQADLVSELDQDELARLLDGMDAKDADSILKLMVYPHDTAGGLMITEYLSYQDDFMVSQVLDDLRDRGEQYSDYDVQYAYVLNHSGQLVGVLRLRDLLLSRKDQRISALMIPDPLNVDVRKSLDSLHYFFHEHPFFGVPVITENRVLVGVVRRLAVRDAMSRRSQSVFLKISGIIGGEELRSMPLVTRFSRRLSWLSLNIVLNIIAASVIAFYQDTLEKAITLAVFLPIISDMSGCSGNQAVAVSMREITLGVIRPSEIGWVLLKESMVGVINGILLGLLLALVAVLWKGNPYLGLVVGSALAANTLLAVSVGGSIPLILKSMNIDPALASGPMLTTITDMFGFFFVLSLASMLLPQLTTG